MIESVWNEQDSGVSFSASSGRNPLDCTKNLREKQVPHRHSELNFEVACILLNQISKFFVLILG